MKMVVLFLQNIGILLIQVAQILQPFCQSIGESLIQRQAQCCNAIITASLLSQGIYEHLASLFADRASTRVCLRYYPQTHVGLVYSPF